MNIKANIKINGAVNIFDDLGNILLKKNQINPNNFANLIANYLIQTPGNNISTMKLGNGGTYIDSSGNLIYNTPNVTANATLYNTTFIVTLTTLPVSQPDPDSVGIDVIYTVTIPASAPAGQRQSSTSGTLNQYINVNNTDNNSTPFKFDELGLFDNNNNMLTHLIFSPIEKTGDRTITIQYTLEIICN